jgi:hypothetical protein
MEQILGLVDRAVRTTSERSDQREAPEPRPEAGITEQQCTRASPQAILFASLCRV